jgi:hypothetical protein
MITSDSKDANMTLNVKKRPLQFMIAWWKQMTNEIWKRKEMKCYAL